MKALIFDSGTLINLSMNGLLYILEKLKLNFKGKFFITDQVKYEVIDRPIGIQRYELGALSIKNLLDTGILELPNKSNMSESLLKKETLEMMDIANHYIQANGQWIKLVSEAEISCLALSDQLTKQNIENLIAIDERTTRMLAEKPENLQQLMSNKLHQRVDVIAKNFKIFSKFRFIRSSEIVYAAYKKSLVSIKGPKVLEALLYATKFKGAAISFDEINMLKKL